MRRLRLLRTLVLTSVAATGCHRAGPAQPTLGSPVRAPSTSLARQIDSAVRATLEERRIPGAAVAVLRHDTLLHIAGYGLADVERGLPVTPGTIFQIASLTKPFTAMAVLMLVEEGRVNLDAPTSAYVRELPAKYSTITVRQLLTHTSGINPDMRRANVDEMELEEFWRRLAERPVSFPPGSTIQYANAGYAILSFIVERASGLPFGEFLRRRVFTPLDMRSSGYRVPPQNDHRHAVGYDLVDGRSVKAPHVFSGWGNSGMETTAEDLVRWVTAIERRELLRGATYDTMFAPGRLSGGAPAGFTFGDAPAHYGLGWFLTSVGGRQLHTHGGAIAGFSSIVNRFPESGYWVIVLSNGKQGADRLGQADGVARAIARVIRP